MPHLCPYVSKKRLLIIFIQVFKVKEQDLFPGGKRTISVAVFFSVNMLLEIFWVNIHVRNLSGEYVYNRTINRNVIKVKCFSRRMIVNFRWEMLSRLSEKRRKMKVYHFSSLFLLLRYFTFIKVRISCWSR